MKEKLGGDPVEVYAGTNIQAGMVKSLLENAGIFAFLKDEIIGTLNPWWSDPGGAGPVRVFVSELDLELALEVVRQYEENISS